MERKTATNCQFFFYWSRSTAYMRNALTMYTPPMRKCNKTSHDEYSHCGWNFIEKSPETIFGYFISKKKTANGKPYHLNKWYKWIRYHRIRYGRKIFLVEWITSNPLSPPPHLWNVCQKVNLNQNLKRTKSQFGFKEKFNCYCCLFSSFMDTI